MAHKSEQADGRPLIVLSAQGSLGEEDSRHWLRLLPAALISLIVNGLVMVVFFAVHVTATSAPQTETATIASEVEGDVKMPNLENDEIGLNPNLPTNYNTTRIEEVSVPGPTNPAESVGILNAPMSAPMTLPPPPGIGPSFGTGGGVDDPARIGTGSLIGLPGGLGGPKMLPGGFGGRSGATRVKMVEQGGGNTLSEAAVAAGLRWLSEHQAPDGHWSLTEFHQHGRCKCTGAGTHTNDVAATAFGLLPFLGAGQTHRPTGDANKRYASNVDRALRYLIAHQNREGGFVVQGSSNTHLYAHGLATIALCEAYALTNDPALRRPAQSALGYIVSAQTAEGGWRYDPRGQTGFDTSVGGWQLMALKSGQMGGLDIPNSAFQGCARWLNAAQSLDGGSYGYTSPPPEIPSPTLSSVGLLCRQYLGWGPRSPGLIDGVRRLQAPDPNNIYYNYYATQVMHHMGGVSWERWNPRMRDLLIETQDRGDKKAHLKGSWEVARGDTFGSAGGRLMSTSLSILTLEVYYRHLPLYRRDLLAEGSTAGKGQESGVRNQESGVSGREAVGQDKTGVKR